MDVFLGDKSRIVTTWDDSTMVGEITQYVEIGLKSQIQILLMLMTSFKIIKPKEEKKKLENDVAPTCHYFKTTPMWRSRSKKIST